MSKRIIDLTPVVTLLPAALIEIEQAGASFNATIQEALDLIIIANVGGGATIFRDETPANTFNLKTIIGGTNVTVDNNANDITINSTGGGATTLPGLTDVTITTRAANEVLVVNPGNTLWINALLSNANIDASAAIAYSKLNLTGAILNADLAGAIAYAKLNLTGAILNTDLAGSIALTKLENVLSARIIVGSATNIPTAVVMSGDATISNTGVVTVSNSATVDTNANLTGMVTSVGNATTVVTNANLTGGVTSVGNAATVITNANLTGDVTSVGNATTIAVDAVDIAMLSATGTPDGTTFLRGDNTWSVPSGGATTLPGLTDVTITSRAANEVLVVNSGNTLWINALLADANISGSAAIAQSKLNLSITNTEVNASAAIAFSKLEVMTSGNILVGSAGNVATEVTMSGDVFIIASGATTIQVDAVDIPMLSATGTPDGTTFLRGDNTWSVPGGAGDMVLASVQTSTGKKTFAADATNAGFNLNSQTPSATVAGDIWRLVDEIKYRNNADTLDLIIATTADLTGFFDTAGTGLTNAGSIVNVIGTASRISVSADAVDIDSGYVGQASITTLGTITTGVWNGTDIALANIVDIATASFLGRTTAATGVIEVLTATQATALLNIFTSTLKGLVPLSGGSATEFLSADGTFKVPAGGGDMVLADVQTVTGAKTFGTIGGAVGKFILAGSTSGSTIVNAAAVAGTTTITFPGITGTVMLNLVEDTTPVLGGDLDTGGFAITFTDDSTSPAGTVAYINWDTTIMQFNIPTGGFHRFLQNNVEQFAIGGDNVNILGNTLSMESSGITQQQVGDNLIITVADATFGELQVNAGLAGFVSIGNANTIAGNFAPLITGTTEGGNLMNLFLQGRIPPADDSGTVPVFILDSRQSDNTDIVTRPLYAIANNNTIQWEIDVNGNVDHQGNNLTNIGDITTITNLNSVAIGNYALATGDTYTGAHLFNAATMRIPVSATPTIAVNGDIAIDTTITDFSTPLIRYFGTESMVILAVPTAEIDTAPADGDVVSYNATTDELEFVPQTGGGGEANVTADVGGGAISIRGSTPKTGVALNLRTFSNGDGMNASEATDLITLAVDGTVARNNALETFNISDAATNTVVPAVNLLHTTSGDMADTFGVSLQFQIDDAVSAVETIGAISVERSAGDDDAGTMRIQTSGAATGLVDAIIIDDTQAVSIVGTLTAGTYTGQSSIVTLGTIATGVWNGTAITYANLSFSADIVNADISASAAIVLSKLENVTSGQIIVGSAGNVPTAVVMSGDIAIIASGLTTIQVDAVDIAMLSATGTPDGTTFLRGDNTWSVPGGSGDMVLASVQTSTGKKTFAADATNAGFNLNSQTPSATFAGDIWRLVDNLLMRNNADTTDITFFSTANRQTAIVNSEIDGAAAIAFSKLATLTSGNILVGSAGNVVTSVSMSGDVAIIASGTTTIQDEAVTLAKMAHIATSSILGRVTAATGDVEVLTSTQATTLINVFTSGLKGLVPASGGSATEFLSADGTFKVPAGGGDMVLADVQTVTGAKTFGTIGGAVGKFILAGSTSGSTIVNAAAVAGATTITFPGTTGTVVIIGLANQLTNTELTAGSFAKITGVGTLTAGVWNGTAITYANLSFSADIVNADISASAAIQLLKLGGLTSAQFIIGSSSDVPTARTLTGDIVVGSTGIVAINADVVSFSKFQEITTNRLLGRQTAATGDVEEISLNSTLELVATTTLQRAALTGDVTAAAGNNATTVANVPDGALSANVVLETIANTYAASFLQDFAAARIRIPVSATPTITINGDIAIDTTITDFTTPLIRYFGTESMVIIAVPTAEIDTAPGDGNVLAYNATSDEFEFIAAGAGDMVLASIQTVTGAKTFGTIGGAVGKFILAGSTSGSTIVNAAAVAGATTITFPGTTGTVVITGLASQIVIGTEVTGASTGLTDTAAIVLNTSSNTNWNANTHTNILSSTITTILIVNTGAGTNGSITSNSATNNLITINDQLAINNVGAGADPIFLSNDAGQVLDLTGGLDISGALTTGSYVGDSAIVTVGTITAGVWTGTAITYANLSFSLDIVNADISASAVISKAKIASAGVWQVVDGGTNSNTAQAAIDTLSAVSAATNEHVLTKDTGTGNAIWKVAAGSQTPWASDIDAADFSLNNLDKLEFNNNADTPVITQAEIYFNTATTGMNFNVPTGDEFTYRINGAILYTMNLTELDLLNKNIIGINQLTFDDAGNSITGDGGGLTYVTPSGDTHAFEITTTGTIAVFNVFGLGLLAGSRIDWGSVNRRILNDSDGFIFEIETGNTFKYEVQSVEIARTSATGSYFQLEKVAADTDIPTFGQFWTRDDAPGQTPMWTGDDGVDVALTAGSGDMILASVQTSTGKKTFAADATLAGFNLNNQVPSAPVEGDIWRNANSLEYRDNTSTQRLFTLGQIGQIITENVELESDNDGVRDFILTGYGTNAQVKQRKALGSKAAKTPPVLNTVLGANQFQGWDGSSFTNGVNIRVRSKETWTATENGSELDFRVASVGSSSVGSKLLINGDGNIDIANNLRLNESDTTGLFTIDANHTTLVANDVIGRIQFLDTTTVAPAEQTFGQISMIVHDPTNASFDAEMLFEIGEAGSLQQYIVLNEDGDGVIDFSKILNMATGVNIRWGNDNDTRITGLSTGIEIEAPTGQSVQTLVNNVIGVEVEETFVNLNLPLMVLERAAAIADVANFGQLWVLNTTPQALMFTDEAGVDSNITAGVHDIPTGAQSWFAPTLEPATGLTNINFATNDHDYKVWEFTSTTADERIQLNTTLPRNIDLSDIDVIIKWSFGAGTGAVRWGIRAVGMGDNDALDSAWGTAVEVNDTAGTANQFQFVTLAALAVGGTPGEGDEIAFEVYREGSDAGDTFDNTARLHSVTFQVRSTRASAAI